MTERELEIALKRIRTYADITDGSYYTDGLLDGARQLVQDLGYKVPYLDQLDDPDAKIVKAD